MRPVSADVFQLHGARSYAVLERCDGEAAELFRADDTGVEHAAACTHEDEVFRLDRHRSQRNVPVWTGRRRQRPIGVGR